MTIVLGALPINAIADPVPVGQTAQIIGVDVPSDGVAVSPSRYPKCL